jgi:hypothetical protein
MKKSTVLVIATWLFAATIFALPPNKYNLLMAPGTLTENSITLLWDKQYSTGNVEYEILLNGKLSGTATKTNFTISNLLPNTSYNASLRLKNDKSNAKKLYTLNFKTAAKGKI